MGCLLSKFKQDDGGHFDSTPEASTAAAAAAKNAQKVLQQQLSLDKQIHVRIGESDLKMGSITEVWKNGAEWDKFCAFLDNCEPEGFDSEGNPMKLSRYAKFLRLYVHLHYSEKQLEQADSSLSPTDLKRMIVDIKNDPEGFFDTERCLKCLNAGSRREILANIKRLQKGQIQPGAWILQPAYSPVLDKLNYLLGNYHHLKQTNEFNNVTM